MDKQGNPDQDQIKKKKEKLHRRQKQGWASQKEYEDIVSVYWNGVKKVKVQLVFKSMMDAKGNMMDYCYKRGHGED